MSQGAPSARSKDLAHIVITTMRQHLGDESTDAAIAGALGVAPPNISRALRLGLTPQAAADWSRRWVAAGHPAIGISIAVTPFGCDTYYVDL